jgi:hypothetical protein
MSFNESIKKIEDLVNVLKGDARVEMKPEEFIVYLTEQLAKAADESGEIRGNRIAALRSNIEDVKKQVSFTGSTPTPLTGVLSIVRYTDPGQQPTSSKVVPPRNPPVSSNTFASNEVPPGVSGAGRGPTEISTGYTAPGSGFATPANATFAKAIEDLHNVLKDLVSQKEEPGEDITETKKEETAEETTEETAEETTKEVKEEEEEENIGKSFNDYWPIDMNSEYGLGKVDTPDEPEWGYDKLQ